MKKFIALAIAILMMAALAVPAFAAITEETPDGQGTVTVSYGATDAYTITIPTSITLGDKGVEGAAQVVSAAGVVLTAGKKLTVSVASANDWAVKNTAQDATETIAYTMTYGNGKTEAEDDAVILEVESGNATGSVNMYFTRTGDAVVTATYEDTLTFTAAVENIPTEP